LAALVNPPFSSMLKTQRSWSAEKRAAWSAAAPAQVRISGLAESSNLVRIGKEQDRGTTAANEYTRLHFEYIVLSLSSSDSAASTTDMSLCPPRSASSTWIRRDSSLAATSPRKNVLR